MGTRKDIMRGYLHENLFLSHASRSEVCRPRAWGFFELFPKWKQLLDKKKSSRIKYGYHHVMDLKSKPKLYGAKLLIAVL
ncbi:TPA: hypothetical protein VVJ07_001367 [Streptococcus pneumoniae]|uniref:hypothetical protein n=1 Tax=Streptococcus pneumoniae TaxID=1313 RepID=UPI00177E8034|nr:hypothetical protein [Streptococcus pneumoniae]MDS4549591.1 hypothetical protein [Streptococcus pneumoniae]MDS5425060.1 hypothetical protein [Streptococcus pneumoniae]MDS5469269.1 hypothetical protein [Streptococcus pneumoniae]MDS5899786.1 hypothetical protein [Streptococcus pneumoniae]MDT5919138.1 hypothetical protein [Streptococcus pneumoniae]